MSDADFKLDLTYDAPPGELYRALATEQGVRGWWTRLCELDEEEGGEGSFRFPDADFYARMRVARLEPPRLVEWDCLDSKHPEDSGFVDLHDWIGTTLRFEIEGAGDGGSRLRFTHVGLVPLECAEVCSSAWSFYLGDSLRALLESGEGKPYPQESDES